MTFATRATPIPYMMVSRPLVLLSFSLFCLAGADQNFSVRFDSESPDFKVYVGATEWFRSGIFRIRYGGEWWSSESQDKNSLKLYDSKDEDGVDSIGAFFKRTYSWKAYVNSTTPTKVMVQTVVNTYTDLPVVTFDVVYLTGLTDAADPAAEGNGTLSTFPSFYVEDGEVEKGWMTWSGSMASVSKFGKWSSSESVYGKRDGGFPLVVFDAKMDTATVLSPMNTFMSATQTSFTSDKTKETMLTFGPLSSISTIPAGYTYRTILVSADNVTSAMRRFGEIMRSIYRKSDDFRKTDYSINYLGYWTDNGACYHYYTGNYSDYGELLVAVKKDADSKGLPFHYMQLDSWWYYKGEGGGVKNWTARPDIFPDGIQAVVTATGWPVVAHNRFWSSDTDYAKQFNFTIDGSTALPMDPAFWDYLMSSTLTDWKMIVYEQDWLHTETSKVEALGTELNLGEQWLVEMGASAQRYGVTIQYCMAWPCHVMQSVMIPVVTQTRASGDYSPGNSQWVLGDSTILTHAVGLAAFKDNFRSSTTQPDCAKKYHGGEPAPILEAYVSALSGGPVAPGDMVGTADAAVIMATCMQDGRILKPTHPAMSLDSTIVQRAFGTTGPAGTMTAAFTEISGVTWYYVMAAELEEDYALSGSELPPSRSTYPQSRLNHIAFQYDIRTGKASSIESLATDESITVGKCEKTDFKYIVVAPVLQNGMALFGELDKFVTVSETRFPRLEESTSEAFVTVVGVPSETVEVTLYDGKETSAVDCVIGDGGYANLVISSDPTCS